MKLNWRSFPHPNYSYYGGGKNKCGRDEGCPIPVDDMDAYFLAHDRTLDDWELFKDLLKVNPIKLKGWVDYGLFKDKTPISRTLYWVVSLPVFGIAGGIKKLRRRKKK